MKVSMWLVAERLNQFKPKCDIVDDDPHIEGLRFITDLDSCSNDSRMLYMCTEHIDGPSSINTKITLLNGRDLIVVDGFDAEDVLNAILGAFDFFNHWHESLIGHAYRGDAGAVVDTAYEALGNPMVLADTSGAVLAMTSSLRDDDLNEYWTACRDTGRVPVGIQGAPELDENNRVSAWSRKPKILTFPDGTRSIAVMVGNDRGDTAALSLWEHTTKITHGHLHLMQLVANTLASMPPTGEGQNVTRGLAAILADLLGGVRIDDSLLSRLEVRCCKPWSLITVRAEYQGNLVSNRNLVESMNRSGVPSVASAYDDAAVCLASSEDADLLVERLFGPEGPVYHLVAVSMPFESLSHVRERYNQGLFDFRFHEMRPGLYHDEELGWRYALAVLERQMPTELLVHPALQKLRAYDAENAGGLYDALFYYLSHERSVQKGASATHVHRNTFLYRVRRAAEVAQVDLSDPEERFYLLLSFRLEGQDPKKRS